MCSIAFAALAHLTRGTQIPIAERAARCGPADEHKSRFPPLEVFVRRPPKFAARSDAAGIRKPSHEQTNSTRANVVRSTSVTGTHPRSHPVGKSDPGR